MGNEGTAMLPAGGDGHSWCHNHLCDMPLHTGRASPRPGVRGVQRGRASCAVTKHWIQGIEDMLHVD